MSTFDNQSRTPLGERIADVGEGRPGRCLQFSLSRANGSERGRQRGKKKERICFILSVFPEERYTTCRN